MVKLNVSAMSRHLIPTTWLPLNHRTKTKIQKLLDLVHHAEYIGFTLTAVHTGITVYR